MTRKTGKPTRSGSSSSRTPRSTGGTSKRGPSRGAGSARRGDEDKPFKPRGEKESSARPERSARSSGRPSAGGPKKSYGHESTDRPERPGRGAGRPSSGGPKKTYNRESSEGSRPYRSSAGSSASGDYKKKSYGRSEQTEGGRTARSGAYGDDKRKSYGRKERSDEASSYRPSTRNTSGREDSRQGSGRYERSDENRAPRSSSRGFGADKPFRKSGKTDQFGRKSPYKGKYDRRKKEEAKTTSDDGTIRLNKYLSNAGVASRREADEFIRLGLVKVNGEVITELGHKIDPSKDKVQFDGQFINREKHRYVLLNKPKDYITTMEDEKGRRTVMNLVKGICKERIYPVGRLDRNTTGLLLFTNDGDLAKRLLHPRHGYPKIYHVELLEKVSSEHIQKIRDGFELEDGFIKADEVSYVGEGKDKHQVGIRIHSGRNRIVRRIFEHLGYTIKKLDRVSFAGLTKKDLPRGRARLLTEQEIQFLSMIR